MTELKEILESFTKIKGVNAAIVMKQEGEIIESANSSNVDLAPVAKLALDSFCLAKEVGQELDRETILQSIIEHESGMITTEILEKNAILVIVAASKANLGMIRFEARKNKKAIEDAI
jgi:uncharacterized protein